jgi:hypothetical protein
MEFIRIPWCLLRFHEECEINKLSGAFSPTRMRAEASIDEPLDALLTRRGGRSPKQVDGGDARQSDLCGRRELPWQAKSAI